MATTSTGEGPLRKKRGENLRREEEGKKGGEDTQTTPETPSNSNQIAPLPKMRGR